MTKKTLVAAVAAQSLVACAQNKHHDAKSASAEPTVAAPTVETPSEKSAESNEAVKAESTKAEPVKAEAPAPKHINAMGPDLKCTDEFLKAYPEYAVKVAETAKNLAFELAEMAKVVSNLGDSSANHGRVKTAFAAYETVFKDFKQTFFPYACWLPGSNLKKLQFSSEEQQKSYDDLRTKVVTKALGAHNVGPAI